MPVNTGLQRESVSNLGNNLFAFVLGSAAIIGVLAYDETLIGNVTSGGTVSTVARLISLLGIIILVLYYVIDWYDLNLAVYIDEFVGRKQVCLYVLAGLLLAALPPLILGGRTNIAALLAAVYFPLAEFQRNKLLQDGEDHLLTTNDAVAYGERRQAVKMLRWVLWSLSIVTIATVICTLFFEKSPWTLLCVAIALVLLWLIACVLKTIRSVCFLQDAYERRLNSAATAEIDNAELFDAVETVGDGEGTDK